MKEDMDRGGRLRWRKQSQKEEDESKNEQFLGLVVETRWTPSLLLQT